MDLTSAISTKSPAEQLCLIGQGLIKAKWTSFTRGSYAGVILQYKADVLQGIQLMTATVIQSLAFSYHTVPLPLMGCDV